MATLRPGASTAACEQVASLDNEVRQVRSSKMQKYRKFATVVVVASIAAAIGIVASLSIGTGWRAYTVHGGSMQPHYSQGDLIITSSVSPRNIESGEIIVFTADWASEKFERRVVHRVAAVGTIDGLPVAYTRGDANSIADPQPVNLTADHVTVVRFSVSNGAFWLGLLTAPYTLAIFFASVGMGVVALAMSKGLRTLDPRGAYRLSSPVPVRQQPSAVQPERAL